MLTWATTSSCCLVDDAAVQGAADVVEHELVPCRRAAGEQGAAVQRPQRLYALAAGDAAARTLHTPSGQKLDHEDDISDTSVIGVHIAIIERKITNTSPGDCESPTALVHHQVEVGSATFC